jgi:hypothetical protein
MSRWGCTSTNRQVIACRYGNGPNTPLSCNTPNMAGCYEANVLAPSKTAAQCANTVAAPAPPAAAAAPAAAPAAPAAAPAADKVETTRTVSTKKGCTTTKVETKTTKPNGAVSTSTNISNSCKSGR